jgi:hypothetical protein
LFVYRLLLLWRSPVAEGAGEAEAEEERRVVEEAEEAVRKEVEEAGGDE